MEQKTMELKDFVNEALTQIITGVCEAQEKIYRTATGAAINPTGLTYDKALGTRFTSKDINSGQDIEFDIAVTTLAKEGKNTKAGIAVVSSLIGLGGAKGKEN